MDYELHSFSGESVNCYGMEIVRRRLLEQEHNAKPFSLNGTAPILVSVYWPEQIYRFVKWRYGLPGRRVIVGGNYPTTSPQALLPFDVDVFQGDGELFSDPENCEYIYRGYPVSRAIADRVLPRIYEDVQQTRRSFCEISRGCRNRCLFCQYGWLKPYREASLIDIEEVIKQARTKSIRVFAADRFAHSQYPKVREIMNRMGKNDTGSDITIREILKYPERLDYTNKVRVGVEGMSARLRKLVKKPYTDDEIVTFCRMVADAGIKSLDFYMIYGLPTETDDDVDSFRTLLARLDEEMPEGYTIAIHWNAFTPNAQTPFQWAAAAGIENHYLNERIMESHEYNNRIKIYHKPKLTSEWTLIKRMLAIRGGESMKAYIFAVARNEARCRRGRADILRAFKEAEGVDLMGEWPLDKPLPWDDICIYEREKMEKLYRKAV